MHLHQYVPPLERHIHLTTRAPKTLGFKTERMKTASPKKQKPHQFGLIGSEMRGGEKVTPLHSFMPEITKM